MVPYDIWLCFKSVILDFIHLIFFVHFISEALVLYRRETKHISKIQCLDSTQDVSLLTGLQISSAVVPLANLDPQQWHWGEDGWSWWAFTRLFSFPLSHD